MFGLNLQKESTPHACSSDEKKRALKAGKNGSITLDITQLKRNKKLHQQIQDIKNI